MSNGLKEFYDQCNDIRIDVPQDLTLHGVISRSCQANPDRTAVASPDGLLTYRQMDKAANQLANHLISRGVRKGDWVGVCCQRNHDIPVLLNGILRAGAAWVPLDPDYPLDRLRYMAENATLNHVVAHTQHMDIVNNFGCEAIFYDGDKSAIEQHSESNPEIKIDPHSDVAYIIYTSGSTGKPKGVLVPHASVVNLLYSTRKFPGFEPIDRMLATATLSFDMSITEIFLPLFTGGQTVIVDRATAKDQNRLVAAIKEFGITYMNATPAHWRLICEADFDGGPQMTFIAGGEPLPRDLIQPLLDRCGRLFNGYGPTEGTAWTSFQQILSADERILIGTPVANTTAYIVDPSGELCPPEKEGELFVGGAAVTLGYHDRPQLTAEKFIDFQGERVYRTGDLARILENGHVEHLGRIDNQIKLYGHRIELGEIDAAMAMADDNVRLAAAVLHEGSAGEKRLVGYVMPRDGMQIDVVALKNKVAETLPDYMMPATITVVHEFPYTPSGKIDRKSFPDPSRDRPDIATEYVAPATERELQIAQIWQSVLHLDQVGTGDNFFDLGGNSIRAVRFVKQFNDLLGGSLSNAEFFDKPTIQAVAAIEHSVKKTVQQTAQVSDQAASNQNRTADSEFAVVGMAARLPGANSVGEFWDNLTKGRESIRFFNPDELDSTLPPDQTSASNYVAARGIVENAADFDARFFGMPPREASLIDPQQRVMLELSWHALEDAGCDPDRFDGKIGVWAGTYKSSYFYRNLLNNPEVLSQTGEFQLGVYNEKDFIATRVAHKLNLKGPAINVNTACSTSLVAIIQACDALRLGQCDAAIAGGVSIQFPQNSGHLHQEGNIFSPDGHCRPFDANSAGTLFSDGGGCVVIKRLSDAVANGDHIYGVIKGFGVNNDGGDKASFSAPSIEGQADAISLAHQSAGVPVESIGYVEAHGTATPIGDPIEVAALCKVFDKSTTKRQFCGIGSVKSNIGHTVAAAGVTGFIKAILALHHEKIPATLHYKNANPQIDFPSTPFYVVDQCQPWPRAKDKPRRAAVSSFGVGGTNAHVVMEEAPLPVPASDAAVSASILKLSASSQSALKRQASDLADAIKDSHVSLAQIAATLDLGRKEFAWRGFAVASTKQEAASLLEHGKAPGFIVRKSDAKSRQPVFMFPGQGAQYVRMGQDLYSAFPIFRDSLDRCSEIMQPLIKRDLRDVLFPPAGDEQAAAEILRATQFTQPALFSIGVSLARTLIDLGIKPQAMIGHSIGEFAAACVAGVFSLEDGLKMIARRGELMQALPEGSMLSVRESAAEVEKLIGDDVELASLNGPKLCVIAGPDDAIKTIQQKLEALEIVCRPLHTSHAFHSGMMDPIVKPYEDFVAKIQLSNPSIPIFSTVTGQWMTDAQATNPRYWAEHLRKPVRFSDAVTQIWDEDPSRVLIELGPRKTLATLAMQHASDRKSQLAIPTMSDTSEDFTEQKSLLTALAQLWSVRIQVDTQRLYPANTTRVSLPGYPFERKKFFVEPPVQSNPPPPDNSTNATQIYQCEPITFENPQPNSPSRSSNSFQPTLVANMSRKNKIIEKLNEVFENTSGIDLAEFDAEETFFEMGLDSLVLTQTATALKRELEIEVTFRQLLEETPTVDTLADFIADKLPSEMFAADPAVAEPAAIEPATNPMGHDKPATQTVVANLSPSPQPTGVVPSSLPVAADLAVATPVSGGHPSSAAESIIQNQLQIMAAQLQVLGSGAAAMPTPMQPASTSPVANENENAVRAESGPAKAGDRGTESSSTDRSNNSTSKSLADTPAEQPSGNKKAFGAAARVNLNAEQLTPAQQQKLDDIISRTNEMMPGSKAYAQSHRQHMADPRTVSGFRPNMKEMTHPIVVDRSKGVYLWDLDGNQYIDYTCGYGSNFLGHGADFIIDALNDQANSDFSIGPQSPLAGEVADLFCELTGNDRVAFANTGSEAVLGCTRLARTYTGKDKIVIFADDYHGILDEVIVRGNKKLKSFPAATGIPKEHVGNTLILEYGSPESLRIIRENLDDLAGIVVETVQSRRPELQPVEFLRQLRDMTQDVDTALIFDEVITGFRIAPGGAQQHFDIRADLAAYGKVVGGGMPIGLIAGKACYMDGLDGGFWQYGDDSRPEAGMTYFAGTFVRHPLTLSAARAILRHIKQSGQPMYDRLNALSDNLAEQLNNVFAELEAPLFLAHFGSLFKVQFQQELPYTELVFAELRLRGFHIWDHRPCLLTLAHTQQHVDEFVQAFRETLIDLQRAGFVPGNGYQNQAQIEFDPQHPPTADAKVGHDRNGNPGWFVADSDNPGQFIQIPQT